MPDNGSPAANLSNMVTDAVAPGARDAYKAAEDDKKCRSFGYSPEVSNFYGQCRMQLEQLRANSAVPIDSHSVALFCAPWGFNSV